MMKRIFTALLTSLGLSSGAHADSPVHLFPDSPRTPARSLEEYLRALWALAQNWPYDIIPAEKLAGWFRDAFTAEVPPSMMLGVRSSATTKDQITLGVLLGSNASCSKSRIFGAWQRLVCWRMNIGTSGSNRRQAFGGTTLIHGATSKLPFGEDVATMRSTKLSR